MNRTTVVLGVLVVLTAGGFVVADRLPADAGTPVAFAELCPVEAGRVAEILIRDGATGIAVTSSDQAHVQDFCALMEGTEFTPNPNRPLGTGWRYYVDLIEPDGSAFRIAFAGDVRCDRIDRDGGYSVERGSWHKCSQDLTVALGELYDLLATR